MDENEFQERSLGEIIDLIKQYEEAEKSKRQAFFDEDSYDQIIQFYFDNREYNKALRVTEAALQQYSFSSFFYTKKAEILANQKRFDEALPVLDEAERLDPNDINIFLIRADVHLWEGRHQEAMEVMEHALSIATEAGDLCELFLEMADIWEDQEKYLEVINCLKNALRQEGDNEEALSRMWFCTELTETYEDSLEFHQQLIDENPYSYLAWFNLGHSFAGLGMYEKAIEAYGYVTAIEDTYEPAYTYSGDIYFTVSDYNDALNFYYEAIKLTKPNKELYLKVAACYERMEEYAKSRTYLRKAITVDPYYDEAFYRIGEIYKMEEKWPKAITSYERAVKLNRENIDYLTALGEAYLVDGQGDKSVEIFERIFQIDPQSKQNWINLATAYFNVENFRKAFQVLTEAENKYENNADIFYIKSVFYYQVGNRHEALLNLEKGLLQNFDEHFIVFEMDETLQENASFLQVIEQYRPNY